MSITWYKLKIKKQLNEYECYIRFKFDYQIQSIKIKSFIYLIDEEGNISLSDKKNKFGYDPRILGSLTIEKNFFKIKRKKNLYFDVMKYQGNFNICNLSLIDDYFKNGRALIYQYREMINWMDNKKYKIQMGPKKFTMIFDVNNWGYIKLNLYSKLEEVERQELIFLHQNEDALCHRYLSNKSENLKNKKDNADEIEIIEEDENDNFIRGNTLYNHNGNNKLNIEEEKDTKEEEENLDDDNLNNTLNTYEVNSDESSVYDSMFVREGNDNENNNNNNDVNNEDNDLNKILLNATPKGKIVFSYFSNDNNKNIKSKNNRPFDNPNNCNANYNININSLFNNDNNNINLFEKLKKEGNNIISSNYENKNQSFTEYSTKKEAAKSKSKKVMSEKKYNPFNNILTSSLKIRENTYFDYTDYKNNNNSKKIIFDSLISSDSEKNILLYSSGFESSKFKLKLLYKSSNDSDNILIFHNKCDYIKNVFVIILTLDNKKFGFFTSKGLSSSKNAIYDNKAFLFKLNKEEIDCFQVKSGEIALYGSNDYVLNLGGEQLIIRDKFLSNASFCGLKMKNYKTNINYQINSGNKNFIIKEMEVYCVIEI